MYGFFITKNVRNLSMSLKVDFVKKWIKIFSILSVWKLDQIEAQEVVIISQMKHILEALSNALKKKLFYCENENKREKTHFKSMANKVSHLRCHLFN